MVAVDTPMNEVTLTRRDWQRWCLGLIAQSVLLIVGGYAVINSRLTTIEVDFRGFRELYARDNRELNGKVSDLKDELRELRAKRAATP